jgi:pyruvate formate lyase activating enzyme
MNAPTSRKSTAHPQPPIDRYAVLMPISLVVEPVCPAMPHVNRSLQVGGFTAFSATDFPGQLAAVVFVQGCPWACNYCHNPHLQPRLNHSPVNWTDVTARLRRRVGLLDAVVFSGGEPTMDPTLANAIREVRQLGFMVGLHTAGMYTRRLIEVLPLVDWVGLDIKALAQDYARITATHGSADAVWRSLRAVLDSGVTFECRTTVHPDWHCEKDVLALAEQLHAMGVRNYALQAFRDTSKASATFAATSKPLLNANRLSELTNNFDNFVYRSA